MTKHIGFLNDGQVYYIMVIILKDISHENQQIPILTIKESQIKVKTSSLSHKKTSRKGHTKLRTKHNTTKAKQGENKKYTTAV